jgi:hypothetical protein
VTQVTQVRRNQLKWLPPQLGQLPALEELLVRLLGTCTCTCNSILIRASQLERNPLPGIAGRTFKTTRDCARQCAHRFVEIIAATTHIGFIRERAAEICIALQDLELPAFVTLTIIDEAVHENSIRMWAKWELITAFKHYRDRRGVESE